MKITNITASQILDSAKLPALQVQLEIDKVMTASASVPTGVSVGKYEKRPIPIEGAFIQIENEVKPALAGRDFSNQEELDELLQNLNLGANVSLAISVAFCQASQYLKTLKFPKTSPQLLMLLVEGGKHAQNRLTFQEFLVVTQNFQTGQKIFEEVGQIFRERKVQFNYGLEGGYSPQNLKNEEVLKILNQILDIKLGLDIAAASVPQDEINYQSLLDYFPIFSFEDPYSDEEWEKWQILTQKIGEQVLVIGDDLTVTNPERVKKAIELGACNALIVKPNQIGTVSQTLQVVKLAKQANLKIVVSHRGQETPDTFIADLAYYIGADFVKFGAPKQEERLVKYKRLEELQLFTL